MDGREQTVQYLTQMKRELVAKREKLLKPVQEIEREIEHVTSTLSVVLRNGALDEKESPLGFPVKKLRGMTQAQALIAVAEYNGGTIKALEARAILVAGGVMRNTKNAARMVHSLIARSEVFLRTGRGEYRLKDSAPLRGDGTTGVLHLQSPVQ